MRKLFASKRGRILVVCAVVAVLFGGGGAAFAYFTSSGSGTGSATVGTAGTWGVTQTNTTGTIYPGTGSSTLTFSVKNNGTGDQSYATATATVNADSSGNITVGGTAVSGCLASWFNTSITDDPGLSTSIAGGASTSVTVSVSMPSNATTDQDACQGKSPDVTLAVN